MALHIQNPEADRLAHELADRTGMSVEDAVLEALREWVRRTIPPSVHTPSDADEVYEKIMEISRHCASLPTYDTRSADEILGYDENGLPT